MNRRDFLFTSLAAPVVAACSNATSPAPRVKTQDTPYAPLTENELHTISVLQNNMRVYGRYTGVEVPESWITDVVPDQFRRSILRRVAGIQPMFGPTSLAFGRDFNEKRYTNMAWLNDHRREMAESFRCCYEDRQPPNFPLNDWAVVSQSQPLNDPFSVASLWDKDVLLRALSGAKEVATWSTLPRWFWDNWNMKYNSGMYVICHPENHHDFVEHRRARRDGFLPIIETGIAPLNKIFFGYKRSDFDASFYFTPYVPVVPRVKYDYTLSRYVSCDGLVTRYGFSPGLWNSDTYALEYNLWAIELSKV